MLLASGLAPAVAWASGALPFARWVDEVVGRLGFEPRQSASKALDLPLVDRPANVDLTSCRLAGVFSGGAGRGFEIPSDHCCPVRGAGQGLRQEGRDAGVLDALLSIAGILGGAKQAKERGTGPGERRIRRGAAGSFTQNQSLEGTQGGMLLEDDVFEVVQDPGADKREKGGLSKILLAPAFAGKAALFSLRERVVKDTGGVWFG